MNENIQLNQHSKPESDRHCLICGVAKSSVTPFMPCDECKGKYLAKGTLLVEVDASGSMSGRLMVIRDIAFEQVFSQTVPKDKVVKVEVGILSRIDDAIKSFKQ